MKYFLDCGHPTFAVLQLPYLFVGTEVTMSKQARTLLLTVAVALVAAACQPDTPTSPAPDEVGQPSFAKKSKGVGDAIEADAYVVEFGGSVSQLKAAVADAGGTLVHASPEIGVATVIDLDEAGAAALKGAARVKNVTRDLMVQWTPSGEDLGLQVATAGNQPVVESSHFSDPTGAFFFPCQWNMTQVNCPAAWGMDEGGDPGVKVAVLDSGIDPFHPDMAGRVDVTNSTTFVSMNDPFCTDVAGVDDTNSFWDFNFHGTFVAGIITSNGLGVASVAPATQIVAVKTNNCLGEGSFGDLIAGIMYAADLPDVDVINMSLGAYFAKNDPDGKGLNGALAKAVNYAGSKGVLVVSAAGNEFADLDKDKNFVHLPSQAGSGIGAWAGDIDGNLASYSNHGRSGAWVGAGGGDLTPGSPQIPLSGCVLPPVFQDGIVSVCATTSPFFGCGPTSYLIGGAGTSFSAPLVAGVAALIDGQAGGSMNAGQLKTALKKTADDLGKKGSDNLFSHGRVNAGTAVDN